ncbi:MAG: phospholipase D-like domain-containing protein [Deltaproteobacteria bacterium]|nr:phospholipase D-like domain-containing protein [Deltaproteobacteria bacterium]
MHKFSFMKIMLSGLLGVMVLFFVSFSTAQAIEKQFQDSTHSCSAILLTNEDYFPALLKAIEEARSEIFMSIFSFKAGAHKNSYPDRILGHLAKAAQRGVTVFVILENTGSPYDELNIQNRQTGKLLAEKGIKVYYDDPKTTTHTKLIVIDQRLVFLGSHNLTQSALKYNNEISILLDRPDLAKRSRDYMLKIIREAK